MTIGDKIVEGSFIAIGTVGSVGAVIAAKQVMDKEVSKSDKLWKRVCIRTAGYGIAVGATVACIWHAAVFIGDDIPRKMSSIVQNKNL